MRDNEELASEIISNAEVCRHRYGEHVDGCKYKAYNGYTKYNLSVGNALEDTDDTEHEQYQRVDNGYKSVFVSVGVVLLTLLKECLGFCQ